MIEKMRHILNYAGDEQVLASVFEIENALVLLSMIQGKVDFLKELKSRRNQSLDQEIKSLEEKEEYVRDVVAKTMKHYEPSEKTIHFPGTGKVTRRKVSASMSIEDSAKLIEYLKEKKIHNELIKTKEYVDSKEVKKALADVKDEIPGVKRTEEDESLSITLEKTMPDNRLNEPQKVEVITSSPKAIIHDLDISDL